MGEFIDEKINLWVLKKAYSLGLLIFLSKTFSSIVCGVGLTHTEGRMFSVPQVRPAFSWDSRGSSGLALSEVPKYRADLIWRSWKTLSK